jgi:multidrug efflux system outer membrane protein
LRRFSKEEGAEVKTKYSTTSMKAAVLAGVLPVFLSSACVVGPKYHRPNIALSQHFRFQIGSTEASSIADVPWWGVFNDKALQDLISEGLANNLDLQVAVARIEQARQEVTIVQSQSAPQIGYQAFAQGQTAATALNNSVGTTTFGAYGGLLNLSWELDIWGRIKHQTEAARANLFAQEYIRRGVMLTLVSDIAADYFQLLELDRELAIGEESAAVFKRTFDLFTLRYQAGLSSRLGVERAKANYDASIANVVDVRRRIGQLEDAISVLVGSNPKEILRGHPLTEQVMPQTPVGTTAAVLERRPDIRQAEQVMIGANEEIGVAVADYFPKVDLAALAGAEFFSLNGSTRGFGVWSLGLNAAGPIFTGGRLKANYNARRAFWDQTIAQYKNTVLTAFRETSDALIAQQTLVKQRASLESQVVSLRQAVTLAWERYYAGRSSYFEVLEAQQQLFPAEDALAQAQRDQLLAVVNLYKALGGGWNLSDAQWNKPS